MSGSLSAPVRQNTANNGGFSPDALRAQKYAAREVILANAVDMVQPIFSTTIASPGSSNNQVAVNGFRLAGFLKRFYIQITATIANGGGVNALNLTQLGLSNILSRVQFLDLSQNVRINAPGWLLHAVASTKRQWPFGFAAADGLGTIVNPPNSQPIAGAVYPAAYSAQWFNNVADNQIAVGTSSTVTITYEVPVTYNDVDLAGGVWLGVTNANPQLLLTINPAPGANSAGDPTLACYSSATGAADCSISSITIEVFQNYLDQIPRDDRGQVILPIDDLATMYMIQDAGAQTGMTVGNDFPIPFANARDYIASYLIYNNAGTLNAGSDINYIAIQAANLIQFKKSDPLLWALMARNTLGVDLPKGMYYLNHRPKPISTAQFGNVEIIVNPSTVNANASLLPGYEMFGRIALVPQAASLSLG